MTSPGWLRRKGSGSSWDRSRESRSGGAGRGQGWGAEEHQAAPPQRRLLERVQKEQHAGSEQLLFNVGRLHRGGERWHSRRGHREPTPAAPLA